MLHLMLQLVVEQRPVKLRSIFHTARNNHCQRHRQCYKTADEYIVLYALAQLALGGAGVLWTRI